MQRRRRRRLASGRRRAHRGNPVAYRRVRAAELPARSAACALQSDQNMASTGSKTGFALAWILGIPLPILLVIYLISRC
jgi:hypothetical protein